MTGALVAVDPDGLARRTRLARDIGEALAKLAVHGTPTDVALALQAGGWRGRPGDATSCPVAMHLREVVMADDDDSLLFVSESRVALLDFEPDGTSIEQKVGSPESVRSFVGRFDRGVYPELADIR